ncbi:hypothetical protein ASG80_06305 [Agromyces sp. Soil535]|nr:hypothetical protein ASG80_06305 [Agromyces sp. Soil535]
MRSWIRARRLDRAREDLIDPAFSGFSVGEIGARWGLSDPAHFCKLFALAFGRSPTEYRALAGVES